MTKILSLLALSLTLMLGPAPTAQADWVYTWTTTLAADPTFGPLSGSFTVGDAAISDGSITSAEVTSYSFSDSLAVFAPPSSSFSVAITVDNVTGAMLGGNLGIQEGIGFSMQDLLIFAGPGPQLYLRNSITPPVAGSGAGTWSVTNTPAAVPEPASLTLLGLGLAGLLGYRLRHRRQTT